MGNRGGKRRVGVEEVAGIDRNGNVPRDHASHEHDRADVEADDVADAQQRRREVGAEVRDPAPHVGRVLSRIGNEAQPTRCGELHGAAGERRHGQDLGAGGGICPGFQNLRSRLALGEAHLLLDHERAAQWHRE